MKDIIVKIIYAASLLLGSLFTYIVFNAFLHNFIGIKLPFPENWDKNSIFALGVFLGLPIISIWLYKIRLNYFDKWIAFTYISFWIIAMIFLVHSVFFK